MFYCNECKEEFEQGTRVSQLHNEVDTRQYETFYLCPYCSSEDFEEMDTCDCGASIKSSEDYCSNCKETINAHLSEMVNEMETSRIKLINYISEL